MREDDLRESSNIEDRRGSPGGGIGGAGVGGLGVGAVLVLTLLGWAFGIDPSVLINTSTPNTLFVTNYNGVIARQYFASLQFSQKENAFENVLRICAA